MKILVDADACPVLGETEELARRFGLDLIIVSDYNHHIKSSYGQLEKVDQAADSADFYIFNRLESGDILVSQDLGLAAMALSKGALCINPNGELVSNDNIDFLLNSRHLSAKLRREQGIYGRIKKRESHMDSLFKNSLLKLIQENL